MRGIEVVFIDNDTIIIAFKKGLGLEIFSKVNNYQKKDSRDVAVLFLHIYHVHEYKNYKIKNCGKLTKKSHK